jgi:hypothetical protein
MTTIVNNPAPAPESNNGVTMIIVAFFFIGIAALFNYVGIPAIRRMGPAQMNVPATQVVIPGKIDVNVSQAK